MAKEGQSGRAGLDGILGAASDAVRRGPPPVHLWNPPFCGDLDMRIAADGTWYYLKTPIGRPALVRLFASVLKREGDKYFLVTPVEKCGIQVEDSPFLAVELRVEQAGLGTEPGTQFGTQRCQTLQRGQTLHFRTNVDDWVACEPGHGLRFEMAADGGITPYLHVRADLWAKVTRALYYDLVDMGEPRMIDGEEKFGVESGGEFFAMADAEQVRNAL